MRPHEVESHGREEEKTWLLDAYIGVGSGMKLLKHCHAVIVNPCRQGSLGGFGGTGLLEELGFRWNLETFVLACKSQVASSSRLDLQLTVSQV